MQTLIRQLGIDFLNKDFQSCEGAIDFLLHDRGHSIDRVAQFLCDVYRINEVQAIEILGFLNFIQYN